MINPSSISSENLLFEFAKIKIELEFINKHRYKLKFEKLKKIIKERFSEVSLELDFNKNKLSCSSDVSAIMKKLFFVKFFESYEIKDAVEENQIK